VDAVNACVRCVDAPVVFDGAGLDGVPQLGCIARALCLVGSDLMAGRVGAVARRRGGRVGA